MHTHELLHEHPKVQLVALSAPQLTLDLPPYVFLRFYLMRCGGLDKAPKSSYVYGFCGQSFETYMKS
jgi:hypothetical protein